MRIRTEWLVLPLFLFPGLIVGGFVWWAQDRHRNVRAPYRREGRAQAEAWLADGGPAAWMRERVAALARLLTSLDASLRDKAQAAIRAIQELKRLQQEAGGG